VWPAVLLLTAALLYVIIPWDFDFVPLVGRLDDVLFVLLALYYYRKRKRSLGGRGGASESRREGSSAREEPGATARGEESDPYLLLGVDRGDGEDDIKRAYREMLGKYHPDRVQHLGEEFREMAAQRTKTINLAWQRVREERNFS
jgi:hypothetical protein